MSTTKQAGPPSNVVTGVIKAMRPRQWVKNLLVLAAPLAALGVDKEYDYKQVFIRVGIAFVDTLGQRPLVLGIKQRNQSNLVQVRSRGRADFVVRLLDDIEQLQQIVGFECRGRSRVHRSTMVTEWRRIIRCFNAWAGSPAD